MAATSHNEAVKQLASLIDQEDETLKRTFKNVHQGYPTETFLRFLKAREWSVPKAHKMLVDCLNWRVENEIDAILSKPILPAELHRGIRDSQLIGLSGYSKEGLPVFAIGVGLSTYDKASVNQYIQSYIQINEYRDRVILPAASKKYGRHISTCIKVLDMTGLKLSAMSQLKLLTLVATIDDLNYPEKTQIYYVANAPYIFSACWKVVKPLLHERTRGKVQVLRGCGRDELLKVMDSAALPHFCRREGSEVGSCFSAEHSFHQQLYNYTKQQSVSQKFVAPLKKNGAVHVDIPELKSELYKFCNRGMGSLTLTELKIEGL